MLWKKLNGITFYFINWNELLQSSVDSCPESVLILPSITKGLYSHVECWMGPTITLYAGKVKRYLSALCYSVLSAGRLDVCGNSSKKLAIMIRKSLKSIRREGVTWAKFRLRCHLPNPVYYFRPVIDTSFNCKLGLPLLLKTFCEAPSIP